jgi:hypothetical protein
MAKMKKFEDGQSPAVLRVGQGPTACHRNYCFKVGLTPGGLDSALPYFVLASESVVRGQFRTHLHSIAHDSQGTALSSSSRDKERFYNPQLPNNGGEALCFVGYVDALGMGKPCDVLERSMYEEGRTGCRESLSLSKYRRS